MCLQYGQKVYTVYKTMGKIYNLWYAFQIEWKSLDSPTQCTFSMICLARDGTQNIAHILDTSEAIRSSPRGLE
jgi:hypothetical protein